MTPQKGVKNVKGTFSTISLATSSPMDEDSMLIGSPITVAELKALGGLVRWQDLEARVAALVAAKSLPNGYPKIQKHGPRSNQGN
jgi:hypothetical protein